MSYDFGLPKKKDQSMMQQSVDAMANVFAAIAAMLLAPLLYDWTARYFLEIAGRSYDRDMLELLDVVWLVLMYPAVFFTARASIYVALTAGISAAAMRLA